MMKKLMCLITAILICMSLSMTSFAVEPSIADFETVSVSMTAEPINPLPEAFLTEDCEIYLSEPIPFTYQDQSVSAAAEGVEVNGLIAGTGQFAIVRRFPDNLDCIVYFTWDGEQIGWVSTTGLEIYPGNIFDNTLIDYIPDTMKNADGASKIWIPIDNVDIPTEYETVVVIGNMNVYVLSTASWALQTFPSFRVTIKNFDGI